MSYIVLCQGLWTGWDAGSHYILLCTRFNIWLHAMPDSTAGEHKITDTFTMCCTVIQVHWTESLKLMMLSVCFHDTREALCSGYKMSWINKSETKCRVITVFNNSWSNMKYYSAGLLHVYLLVLMKLCSPLPYIGHTIFTDIFFFVQKKEKIKGTVCTDHLNYSMLVSPHLPNNVSPASP